MYLSVQSLAVVFLFGVPYNLHVLFRLGYQPLQHSRLVTVGEQGGEVGQVVRNTILFDTFLRNSHQFRHVERLEQAGGEALHRKFLLRATAGCGHHNDGNGLGVADVR